MNHDSALCSCAVSFYSGILSAGGPGGDLELSMQLWWRAAALQALPVLLGALGSGAEGRYSLEQHVSVFEALLPMKRSSRLDKLGYRFNKQAWCLF
jgi:hypothetical protein